MKLDLNSVLVGIAVAAITGGVGYFAMRPSTPTTTAAPSAPAKVAGGPAAGAPANTALPANHPPMAATGAGAVEREGKVSVDRLAKFVHFRTGNRNVKDIYADGNRVWVGTSGGVIRYDTKTDQFKLFDNTNGLLSNGIFHVGRLDGRIVLGTYGGGMALFDEKTEKWDTLNVPDGLGDAFVYDVLKAKNGDVWIATWSGVNRVRGGTLKDRSKWELHTVESTKGGLPNDWVYGLAEGLNGDIWLATEGGLARVRGGQWENWNHAKGLGAPYEKVKDALTFKTDPAKLSQHHARQKQEMGLEKVDVAFNPNYIVSLVVDKQGVVWAGTWGGGLSRFDGKAWTHFTTVEGLPGNHVFMLHIDPKDRLWIGTNNGLARMDGSKFRVLNTDDGLFANNVFSMATGDDGSVWVGSYGGVAHIAQVN